MARKFGDWRVLESVGEGGQAHAFLVKRESDDTQIGVLKRLKNRNRKERFAQEFQVMKGEDGKFFPRILDADLEADSPYYVMEHFKNGCLSLELTREWSLDQKLRFYHHLVLAVSHANNKGIVHRDLKPENILVADDLLPRVSDFGICFVGETGGRQTMTDEAVGSFRFMAPEMEDGRSDSIGPWTDVYSLGKLAYWLFAARVYNRERHRDPAFDLTRQGKEHWRHFFNDFLDEVTAPKHMARPQATTTLLKRFEPVRRAMQEDVRYLDLEITLSCTFCKLGEYGVAVDDTEGRHHVKVDNFGFRAVGKPLWLILVCDRCGNVQPFRKDLCPRWEWR